MGSQPQNPELRNNPENFHLCDLVHFEYMGCMSPPIMFLGQNTSRGIVYKPLDHKVKDSKYNPQFCQSV